MDRQRAKRDNRRKRQLRTRRKVFGTPERPRLAVYRSLRHIYCQLVDDLGGRTLASASSPAGKESGGNREAAAIVGRRIAEAALEKGIARAVFDRRGYRYHGRVKALADAAREGGLQF